MANEQHIRWLLEGVEAWNRRCLGFEPARFLFMPDFENAPLYEIFRDAGKLDQENRIPLAGADLENADLTGANLGQANLTGANLENAYLTNAILGNANLTSAYLMVADLTGARLGGANLTDAEFMSADLRDADLMFANLTKANFPEANLNRANLTGANLMGTFLEEAEITGANLTASEPWKAVLYHSDSEMSQHNKHQPNPIKDIEQLLFEIQAIDNFYNDTTTLYFRGEHKNEWGLYPSIMRDLPAIQSSLHRFESEMLTRLTSSRPDEFNGMSSALAQWVLARHHGLPTRFLDITRNPLVALFHACDENDWQGEEKKDGRLHAFAVPGHLVKPFTSDAISVIANFARLSQRCQRILLGEKDQARSVEDYPKAMNLLYQLVRQEKPYFDNRIDPRDFYRIFVVEPQESSDRIRAQSAAFLVSAFHKRFEREEILAINPGIPVYAHYTMTIQGDCKDDILRKLRLLNITRETLFPGLDTSAEAITQSYRARL